MEAIRTLVVDDEPEAREGVRGLLARDPEVEIVGECRTGREAVAAIGSARPDLVLLDIQMPELDGFGVLAEVGAGAMPHVVFVTAYDHYALRAFEAHALDYLLKPFSDARFADAMARAKAQVRQRHVGELGRKLAALLGDGVAGPRPEADAPASLPIAADAAPARPYLDRIMVRLARNISFVRVEEVDWIEAADYYAKLHVAKRAHLIRETMQELEKKLDPERFVRVHRSAIVNVDRIQTLQPYFRGGHVILLRDGTRLSLSRSRRAALEQALGWRI